MLRKGGRKVSKAAGKRKAGKFAARRRKMIRRNNPTSDYAKCVVSKDLGYDANGQIIKYTEWSLAGFTRAVNVAQSYQFYRISQIEMKFTPTSDTYISGNPGEVPHFYYVIDKSDSIPNVGTTLDTLMNAGAKPIRFDDKTITVRWKPAVTWKALDENGTSGNFALTRVSPWLATNDNNTSDTAPWQPSSVDHHGIVYTATGGVAGQNYGVKVSLTFEFKKPLQYTVSTGNEPPVVNKKV